MGDIIKKPGMHQNDKLNQKIKGDKLKQEFAARTDKDELHKAGILQNKGMADSLQATASKLESAKKTDALKKGIGNQVSKDELHKVGILQNKGMANSLQATANKLEKEIKSDSLQKQLKKDDK